jgi:hypothetical protein
MARSTSTTMTAPMSDLIHSQLRVRPERGSFALRRAAATTLRELAGWGLRFFEATAPGQIETRNGVKSPNAGEHRPQYKTG